jgi:hypothetical protein
MILGFIFIADLFDTPIIVVADVIGDLFAVDPSAGRRRTTREAGLGGKE